MKYFLLLMAFCYCTRINAKDYKITVAVNLKDCINCIKAFYQVTQVQDQADIVLLLNREYQSDSAFIFKKYNLGKLHATCIWSDSMFAQYSPNGNSTITLESRYGVEKLCYLLSGLREDFFDYLLRASKATDTLFKNVPNITRGVDKILFHDDEMALPVNYRKEVDVYNILSQKPEYTITIPDSILRQTFVYSGLPASEYDRQQEVMKQAGVPERYQLTDVFYLEDTILVQLNNRFFQYKGPDTILAYNFSFLKFYRGKPVAANKFNYLYQIEGHPYWIANFMHSYKGQIYEFLDPQPLVPNRYFLGKCNMEKDIYTINALYPMRIPALYEHSDGCSFPAYYKGYFAFPLIGTLYPLDERDSVVRLPFFPKMEPTDNPCAHVKAFIYSFMLNKDYVWLVMANEDDTQLQLVKYNRSTGKEEIAPIRFLSSRNTLVVLDPINPDYVIYKAGKNLVRQKAFK